MLLKRAGIVLRSKRDELASLMTAEMGKPIVASEAEVDKCAGCLEYFAENGHKFLEPRVIGSDASKSYVRFDPIGPVLAIMPWNFPFWQVVRFAAPTLMAGNVGVLKHAPYVPGCAVALEKVFAEEGFPVGDFSSLLISDNAVAERLIEHRAIVAVTLTGSDRAGRAVSSTAGRMLKKTVMELGGSDPFIVLADADVAAVAAKAAEARCINNGQSCIAAKRFIVEAAVADEFESAMIDAMSGMKVGDPMDRAHADRAVGTPRFARAIARSCPPKRGAGCEIAAWRKAAGWKGFFLRADRFDRSDAINGGVRRRNIRSRGSDRPSQKCGRLRSTGKSVAIWLGGEHLDARHCASRGNRARDRLRQRLYQRNRQIRSAPAIRRHQKQRVGTRVIAIWHSRVRQHQDDMG